MWLLLVDSRDSCHELFRELNILPLKFQYVFFLLLLIVMHRDQFPSNLDVWGINTRYKSTLYLPLANFTLYQREVCFMQEVRLIITYHQLSRTYQMTRNFLKQLSRYIFCIIPFIAWRNILIKTGHDLGFFHIVINMNLVEL
jgi:hypothetical protein